MKYLIDTHVFLWMASSPEQLSEVARKIILRPENDLYVSVCSLWEMQIKQQLGKLKTDMPLCELWHKQRNFSRLNLLAIEEVHIWELEKLPHHHKDPFDRLLIAQAKHENMPLISADGVMARYAIKTKW
jgi:PIN domain nuclease of toxin-antitoxin system